MRARAAAPRSCCGRNADAGERACTTHKVQDDVAAQKVFGAAASVSNVRAHSAVIVQLARGLLPHALSTLYSSTRSGPTGTRRTARGRCRSGDRPPARCPPCTPSRCTFALCRRPGCSRTGRSCCGTRPGRRRWSPGTWPEAAAARCQRSPTRPARARARACTVHTRTAAAALAVQRRRVAMQRRGATRVQRSPAARRSRNAARVGAPTSEAMRARRAHRRHEAGRDARAG